jgi:hypothetical protein
MSMCTSLATLRKYHISSSVISIYELNTNRGVFHSAFRSVPFFVIGLELGKVLIPSTGVQPLTGSIVMQRFKIVNGATGRGDAEIDITKSSD